MGLLAVNLVVLSIRKIFPPGQNSQQLDLGRQEDKNQGPTPRD